MNSIERWIIITPAGDVQLETQPVHDRQTLEKLQHLVGGLIEALHLTDETMTGWANEEGGLIELEPNPLATTVARALGWQGVPYGGPYIRGTVVFTGTDPEEGATIALTPAQMDTIMLATLEVQ